MTSDPDHNRQQTRNTTADEAQADTGADNNQLEEQADPSLSRRNALIGAGIGFGLLNWVGQTPTQQDGRPWKQDVNANGNTLLNLGGLNMDNMDAETLITDFDGSNLEIDDASLNVTNQLDVDRVDTTELQGTVTGGESLQHLAGNNLSIVNNQLTAIGNWQTSGGLLQLSGSDTDGIEVERIEPPENKNLNVESSDDLVLSISGGQGAIRIETDDGHEVVLNDESESLSVKDSGGNSVEMDANTGEVSVSASEKITLDAPEIELSAGVDLTLQSGGNAEMMSSGVMDIKGASVKLNGPGFPAARKGDVVDDDNDLIDSGSLTVEIG